MHSIVASSRRSRTSEKARKSRKNARHTAARFKYFPPVIRPGLVPVTIVQIYTDMYSHNAINFPNLKKKILFIEFYLISYITLKNLIHTNFNLSYNYVVISRQQYCIACVRWLSFNILFEIIFYIIHFYESLWVIHFAYYSKCARSFNGAQRRIIHQIFGAVTDPRIRSAKLDADNDFTSFND